VGASLAFDAALDRYSRQNYVMLDYHIHIPAPDPMTNPSTLERQKFYGVRSTPSYFVDGEAGGGGGSAEMAGSIYEGKVEPGIEKHLAVAPEAAIKLRATPSGSTVNVKATVSKVRSKSAKLRLQIALVEDQVHYSGENGLRFHEMVVRSLAVVPMKQPPAVPAAADKPAAVTSATEKPTATDTPAATDESAVAEKPPAPPKPIGFELRPGRGGSFEYAFDLAQAVAAARAHLEDYEKTTRKGEYKFRQKKDEIDAGNLSVVAFVQDEATKKILQTVYVKVPGGKPGN
jgi:hypothetical protein